MTCGRRRENRVDVKHLSVDHFTPCDLSALTLFRLPLYEQTAASDAAVKLSRNDV